MKLLKFRLRKNEDVTMKMNLVSQKNNNKKFQRKNNSRNVPESQYLVKTRNKCADKKRENKRKK